MATKKAPDARMFVSTIHGYWMSHRTYKTKAGARAFIDKLNRKNRLPYEIVESSEFFYTMTPGSSIYRVAVKG